MGIIAVIDKISSCGREISYEFERWDDPYARGPGLYFVVERDSVAGFTVPMGTNRWPVEDWASVVDKTNALLETARGAAFSCDGAVVIHNGGSSMRTAPNPNSRSGRLPYVKSLEIQRIDVLALDELA